MPAILARWPRRAIAAAASHAPATWTTNLAKSFHRDCLVPGLRAFRFSHANLARCIDGAGAAAFDLGEHAVLRLIDAGQREGIAGRDCIVAGADQPRYCRGRA